MAVREAVQNRGVGRKLAQAAETYEKMIGDKNITIFMGYAGSLSIAGQWKLINWFIENGFVDVLVPTGANISEDIVGAMGNSYHQGSNVVDDVKLLDTEFNRYYDVYGKETDYMDMTELIADFFVNNLKDGKPYSSREITYLLGKWLAKKNINSIVATAANHKVPVFCPAIVDSPYGDAGLIAKSKGFNLVIDNMKDYEEFMRLGEVVKDTGVFYIGGGVPKDFIQLFAVTPDLLYETRKVPGKSGVKWASKEDNLTQTFYPHKYAIQVTTDMEHWGGLSGCTFEEAMSWGKEDINAPKVQCHCDATIALPIIAHALSERIKTKRKQTNFSFLIRE